MGDGKNGFEALLKFRNFGQGGLAKNFFPFQTKGAIYGGKPIRGALSLFG